jgi:membrane-associated PAP2 superfamily phosphatase
MKVLLLVLGFLSAFLLIVQMVMGLLIRSGQASLRTAHFHSGSLMVLVALAYIALSLTVIFSRPRADRS